MNDSLKAIKIDYFPIFYCGFWRLKKHKIRKLRMCFEFRRCSPCCSDVKKLEKIGKNVRFLSIAGI